MIHDRGLEAAEAEIESVVQHCPWKIDCSRITLGRQSIDRRAAGIAEPEKTRHLVEGLTGRIVDGATEQSVTTVIRHLDQHRVSARHQHEHHRELETRVVEKAGIEVRFQVVDTDERNVPGEGQCLGRRHPDQQCAHQARSVRGGDGVDSTGFDTSDIQCLTNDGPEKVEMRSTGDLRNDTSEACVQIDLTRHNARHDVGPTHDDRGGSLVATRFDGENDCRFID